MTDTYDAVYNAVRSKIGGCDVGNVIERAVFQAFDISHTRAILQEAFCIAADAIARPSVLFRPTLSADGTKWCVLLGENLQEGIAGFGDTPAEAMIDFDRAFLREHTPAAVLSAKAAAR